MHSVISFVVRKRWGHEAVELLMCPICAYLRSLRGIIPLIVSPGKAPALLLIVSRKYNLKVTKEKWKDSRKTDTFLIHFFPKLRITFYSVSSVKIHSPGNSYPPKNEAALFYSCDWEKKLDSSDWSILYISVELLIPLGTGQLIVWIEFTEAKRILKLIMT